MVFEGVGCFSNIELNTFKKTMDKKLLLFKNMKKPYQDINSMCDERIPKGVRYEIANKLDYNELMNLCNVNKICSKLCSDDSYWAYRIYDKLGSIPNMAKKGKYREWYMKNVKNLYVLSENSKEETIYRPRNRNRNLDIMSENTMKLMENISNMGDYTGIYKGDEGEENVYSMYVVDSFHNLKHIKGTLDNIYKKRNLLVDEIYIKNVNKFLGVVQIEKEQEETDSFLFVYIDDSNTLIVYQLDTGVKMEISKNVKNTKLYSIDGNGWFLYKLYYIVDDRLYIIKNLEDYIYEGKSSYKTDIYALDIAYIGDMQNEMINEEEMFENLVYVDLQGNVRHEDLILAKNAKQIFEYINPNDDNEQKIAIYYIDNYDILFKLEYNGVEFKSPILVDYNVKNYYWNKYNLNEFILLKNGDLYFRNNESDENSLQILNNFKLLSTNVDQVYPETFETIFFSKII